jgi:hypothetical protein
MKSVKSVIRHCTPFSSPFPSFFSVAKTQPRARAREKKGCNGKPLTSLIALTARRQGKELGYDD